jgi:hypothetical protein
LVVVAALDMGAISGDLSAATAATSEHEVMSPKQKCPGEHSMSVPDGHALAHFNAASPQVSPQ